MVICQIIHFCHYILSIAYSPLRGLNEKIVDRDFKLEFKPDANLYILSNIGVLRSSNDLALPDRIFILISCHSYCIPKVIVSHLDGMQLPSVDVNSCSTIAIIELCILK